MNFLGWRLVGSYPVGDPDGVGSWILSSGGEAVLLELPPGLTPGAVRGALGGLRLRCALASHCHEDHMDAQVCHEVETVLSVPVLRLLHDRVLYLGGEPLHLVWAPKHSLTDVVTVFRGVAMTGDIELGTLGSVNDEVPPSVKTWSMERLRGFQRRAGYRVHTVVSAHLNDVRRGVDWESLFEV